MKPVHQKNEASNRLQPLAELSIKERVFLRYCCTPPPPEPFEPINDLNPNDPPPLDDDPLGRTRRVYGNLFEDAIQDKYLFDIGCGHGNQVLGAVLAGARMAVGVDVVEVFLEMAQRNAEFLGIEDKVAFTTNAEKDFGRNWADVALSQNSFEHFNDPADILQKVHNILKPGGLFFLTFGPLWYHPFGAHHMFMIKMPWAHLLFSKKTILRVRQLFRPAKPTRWQEVSLNKMTIKKLLRLIKQTNFSIEDLSYNPIRPLPRWIVKRLIFREWTVSDVSAILRKPL